MTGELVTLPAVDHRHDPHDSQVIFSGEAGHERHLWRFDVVDKSKGLRIVMDGSVTYGGKDRTTKDRGPLAGLHLEFRVRRRFYEGRLVSCRQVVPPQIAKYAFEKGAEEVSA